MLEATQAHEHNFLPRLRPRGRRLWHDAALQATPRDRRTYMPTRQARQGLLGAIGAFSIWGAFPLYFRPLVGVSALTILAHRVVWCGVVVTAWLALRGSLGSVRAALAHPTTRLRLAASTALIGVNWLVYVWAIGSGHVIDASLGYYINPLVNVVLGVVLLRERLRPAQWAAVACAAGGVAWLTAQAGGLPWVSLALALSFGSYGLIRKVVAVDSLVGLAAETLLLAPLGVAWLVWEQLHGAGAFGGVDAFRCTLLLAAGPVTAVPLAFFAFAARRIPYSTLGVVQYIAPSLQLVFGVFLFGEAFPPARALGFGLIWAGLAMYATESLWRGSSLGRAT